MLRSPMDIPCRVCGAEPDQPCVYVKTKHRLLTQLPGYHAERKYTDFPAARDAERVLLGE